MIKINQLDAAGFYIGDVIVGTTSIYLVDTPEVEIVDGESVAVIRRKTVLPENWTRTLVGDGFFKAQYQGASRDSNGEWSAGEWIETGAPPSITAERQYQMRAELRSVALAVIAPLQYAVDLDIAEEAEAAQLNEWKKYMVDLNRIDKQPGWPTEVTWPSPPA
ncbi:tail fiber assembly protein [Pseudomonas sp. H1h]|uniref:tail fiber assembly protein n=1 Tax=Pseudomonas sp. H1h TaxID=1397280 RepID=UPI00046AFBFA|nr:tail fiber assembly protein [Pseudomonas sp. H1h]